MPGRRGHFAVVFTEVECPRLRRPGGGLRRMPGMPGYPGGIGRRHGASLGLVRQPFPASVSGISGISGIRAFSHSGRGHRGHPGAVKTTPKCPRCSGKTVRDPPHSTRNASMAHRCRSGWWANHNAGPSMLFPRHRWAIVVVTGPAGTTSVGHRCRSARQSGRFVGIGAGAGTGAPRTRGRGRTAGTGGRGRTAGTGGRGRTAGAGGRGRGPGPDRRGRGRRGPGAGPPGRGSGEEDQFYG